MNRLSASALTSALSFPNHKTLNSTLFIKNIKIILGTKGISVNKFANRLDMPLGAVIKFLVDKDFPDGDTILKITKALDTTCEKLTSGENSEEI